VIREVQRLRGAAIALTGMGRAGPEWVAVILPGDSNGPAFLLRAFLATGPVRPAGECEGVRLYQLGMGGSAIKLPGQRPESIPAPREKLRPRDEEKDRDERSVGDAPPPQEARAEAAAGAGLRPDRRGPAHRLGGRRQGHGPPNQGQGEGA